MVANRYFRFTGMSQRFYSSLSSVWLIVHIQFLRDGFWKRNVFLSYSAVGAESQTPFPWTLQGSMSTHRQKHKSAPMTWMFNKRHSSRKKQQFGGNFNGNTFQINQIKRKDIQYLCVCSERVSCFLYCRKNRLFNQTSIVAEQIKQF